jgi:RNA polymerase sporulation-specific sigma factor
MNNINNNDDFLWKAASQGSSEAEEQLLEKYSRLVKICSRPYFLIGSDNEDLIQEGMLGLLSAVRQYDPTRDVSFKSFAELCIRNRLYSAIKSASSLKHLPLNDCVSIDSSHFDESRTRASYFLRDPEELVIARERTDEIFNYLKGSLSKFESEILNLYLSGLSYNEIAEKVGKPHKSVDNAVQRIRKKLTQTMNYGDSQ